MLYLLSQFWIKSTESYNEDVVKSYCISVTETQKNGSFYFKKWAPERFFPPALDAHTQMLTQRMLCSNRRPEQVQV